ncbi:hypothetical protein C900_02819 [Fulvivirga imtechensis AK7]|uniref:DUF4249 domain-containing protein n=1 Tax=Fulvivirga imtechensis AK7 TaxID=1237149 RepID=L8JQW4_9BACT|nr:DUF4249 domain-containing protein [Fulvivirga imtechensis]ELR71361.1 hypothetical protein C900_02819 [Fulvivirga imtechensis AK7]
MRLIIFILVGGILGSCIELVSFDTSSEPSRLVVEATITNISFNDRLSMPVMPEYFTVKLSGTSKVSNERDEPVTGADVTLLDDLNNSWTFEDHDNSGDYVLYDPDFKVVPERVYKLKITTKEGKIYESTEERMMVADPISPLQSKFIEKEVVKDIAGEDQPVLVHGVEGRIPVPENTGEEKFYRWTYEASWEVQADLLAVGAPNKRCWITNQSYFKDYAIIRSISGGYVQPLFFLELSANSRVKHEFSVLVTQYSLGKGAFEFWRKIKVQREQGGGSIFDPPPFEIPSNIFNTSNPDEKTSGYFIVAGESVTRWFIKPIDFPFNITFDDPCAPIPGAPNIPPAVCNNCLDYQSGYTSITNLKPFWWY